MNKELYGFAKMAPKHRSQTEFKDMIWIDSDSGKIVYSVTDSVDTRVLYTA